jgi:hypothetical protein
VITTTDRGVVIHFAGRHHLSPALRDGVPVLAGHGDGSAERCGWAPFFASLEERGLSARLDPEAGAFTTAPRAEAGQARRDHRGVAEARRFLEALRGRYSAGA